MGSLPTARRARTSRRTTAGVVLPPGTRSYSSYQLRPSTVYYLLPGTHVGTLMADAHDSFVGGFARGRVSVLSGDYGNSMGWAIDSNSTDGDQAGVTIEYLTIEKFRPDGNAAAINQDANTRWVIRDNTITSERARRWRDPWGRERARRQLHYAEWAIWVPVSGDELVGKRFTDWRPLQRDSAAITKLAITTHAISRDCCRIRPSDGRIMIQCLGDIVTSIAARSFLTVTRVASSSGRLTA